MSVMMFVCFDFSFDEPAAAPVLAFDCHCFMMSPVEASPSFAFFFYFFSSSDLVNSNVPSSASVTL